MKFYSLCSSSKGNCTYIEEGNSGILVDAGIGIRIFSSSMQLAGLDTSHLKAIFITHEHSDHISGLRKLTERFNVPVYGSKGTLQALLQKDAVAGTTPLYEINRKAAVIERMQVRAFHTSHDSAESLGYTFVSEKGTKAAVCTDLGFVSPDVDCHLTDCDFVFLESNYDERMLYTGCYPPFLKNRIASNSGHLSNEACANEVLHLVANGVKRFQLGHLSEENNRPQVALEHTVTKLSDAKLRIDVDFTLDIAPKRNNGRVIEL